MNERDTAEGILKIIFERKQLTTDYVKSECEKYKVSYTQVMNFVNECTVKKNGYAGYDILILKEGCANFVYKGCWSGEEKREEERRKNEIEENKSNRSSYIIASIVGAIITGIIGYFLGRLKF